MMIQSAVENILSDLSATTIHLWTLSAEDIATIELPNTCLSWLGETERNRHDRLQLERNQNHFLVGQVFLRKVLSNYSATPPDEWSFVTNEYGKPQLSDVHADQQLHFNLSHSGQAYVVAVVVLIETLPAKSLEKIQRRCMQNVNLNGQHMLQSFYIWLFLLGE